MAFFTETLAQAADSVGVGLLTARINDNNGNVTFEITSTLGRNWYIEAITSSGATKSVLVTPGFSQTVTRGWIKTKFVNDSYEIDYVTIRSTYPAGEGRVTDLSE